MIRLCVMSISNDDALEIIQRLKCAAWGGPPATPNRCIYLDDAELVIWDQTNGPELDDIASISPLLSEEGK